MNGSRSPQHDESRTRVPSNRDNTSSSGPFPSRHCKMTNAAEEDVEQNGHAERRGVAHVTESLILLIATREPRRVFLRSRYPLLSAAPSGYRNAARGGQSRPRGTKTRTVASFDLIAARGASRDVPAAWQHIRSTDVGLFI